MKRKCEKLSSDSSDSQPVAALRVWNVSGEEVAAIPVEELSTVKELKHHLSPLCKVPRFKQRLLHAGAVLEDGDKLASPLDVQLVLQGFCPASVEQVRQLATAAEEGLQCQVEELLNRPLDPNVEEHDRTALQRASEQGHEDIVCLLLEAGADKDCTSPQMCGQTPLELALLNEHEGVVHLLLHAGADPNLPASDGSALLVHAARRGHREFVEMLLDAGADKHGVGDVDLEDVQVNDEQAYLAHRSTSALEVACHRGHVNIVRLLLDARADPNLQAKNGSLHPVAKLEDSPLASAVRQGHAELVQLLLEAGATGSFTQVYGHEDVQRSLLWLAVECQHMDTVRLLLPAAAEASRSRCAVVLQLAILEELDAICPLLGDIPDEKLIFGATPLTRATIVRLLLDAEADPNAHPCRALPAPLEGAASGGDLELVDMLLAARANVNRQGLQHTPLLAACAELHVEVVGRLLQARAAANLSSATEMTYMKERLWPWDNIEKKCGTITPLGMAVRLKSQEIVRLLLAAGAEKNHIMYADGPTPLEEAWFSTARQSHGQRSVDMLRLLSSRTAHATQGPDSAKAAHGLTAPRNHSKLMDLPWPLASNSHLMTWEPQTRNR